MSLPLCQILSVLWMDINTPCTTFYYSPSKKGVRSARLGLRRTLSSARPHEPDMLSPVRSVIEPVRRQCVFDGAAGVKDACTVAVDNSSPRKYFGLSFEPSL